MNHDSDCDLVVHPPNTEHCVKCHCTCGKETHIGEVGHPDGCPEHGEGL